MKYQKGDKFVIEITGRENGAYVSEQFTQGNEMRTVFPECTLDSFEKLDSDYINEHYGDLQDEAYKQGMDDAWELARKLFCVDEVGGMSGDDVRDIFPGMGICEILETFTPYQAKSKIEAWEKAKTEIKVGDVVVTPAKNEVLVTSISRNECRCMFGDGDYMNFPCSALTKTGRTIDIASVLEQIGGSR